LLTANAEIITRAGRIAIAGAWVGCDLSNLQQLGIGAERTGKESVVQGAEGQKGRGAEGQRRGGEVRLALRLCSSAPLPLRVCLGRY
jgi:hypothetical protein